MADETTAAVYVISVAAELTGMHPQTLRIYERKGLVSPARTGGGSRRYSDDDVALLLRIAHLTSEGMNLVGVKRVLDLEQRVAQLEAELAAVRSTTDRRYRRDLVPLRQSIAIYERE
ncbi:MAG: heat shock protein transcriptional repressor HspR [Acidimicrobiales bacterium]